MPDGLHSGLAPDLPLPKVALARWFAERLDVGRAKISAARLLPGGAVQHNWRLDVDAGNGEVPYVLRAGPDIPLPESHTKVSEFAFLSRAHAVGIPVPAPLWLSDTKIPFFVAAFVPGDARRDRLISHEDNLALIGDLASALALIHDVVPQIDDMADTPQSRVEMLYGWREQLAVLPAEIAGGLDAGIDWLQTNTPTMVPARLVHRDFRTGNFLVVEGRLTAVLDWEFAGWGDPAEDFGWFCAACWRGDAPGRDAGGLGSRHTLYDAYTATGGEVPDLGRIAFWEVFAHLRWAMIALQQGARAREGAYPAWELREAVARVPRLLDAVARMTRMRL